MKQFYKTTLIILLFIGEFYLLKNSNNYTCNWILYTGLSILTLDIILLLILKIENKISEFKTFFGKTFHSIGVSFFSIISIIYMLAHIGWIVNLIEKNFNSLTYQNIENLPLFIGILFLPFLILSFSVKEKKEKIPTTNRKLLITGISLFDNYRSKKGDLSKREIELLEIIKENEKDYNNWSVGFTKVTWQPIFQSISLYPNIEKLIILSTKESEYFMEALSNNETFKMYKLDILIKKFFPKVKEITYISLNDAHNIQTTINQVSQVIEKESGLYKDNEIVFGITGGTAAVSSALSMLATKGQREIVYKRQDNSEISQDDTNIFNVKELWQEIIEKFE